MLLVSLWFLGWWSPDGCDCLGGPGRHDRHRRQGALSLLGIQSGMLLFLCEIVMFPGVLNEVPWKDCHLRGARKPLRLE